MTKHRSYPTDLTDAEWEIVEPLIPKPQRRGPKTNVDVREVLNESLTSFMRNVSGGHCLTTLR